MFLGIGSRNGGESYYKPLAGRLKVIGFDNSTAPDRSRYGQALTGDALYFRDPVTDRIAGRTSIAWDSASLLRLCTLFDLLNYGDCAIELLQDFRQHKILDFDFDVEEVIDALTPEVMVGPDKGAWAMRNIARCPRTSETGWTRSSAPSSSVLRVDRRQ